MKTQPMLLLWRTPTRPPPLSHDHFHTNRKSKGYHAGAGRWKNKPRRVPKNARDRGDLWQNLAIRCDRLECAAIARKANRIIRQCQNRPFGRNGQAYPCFFPAVQPRTKRTFSRVLTKFGHDSHNQKTCSPWPCVRWRVGPSKRVPPFPSSSPTQT